MRQPHMRRVAALLSAGALATSLTLAGCGVTSTAAGATTQPTPTSAATTQPTPTANGCPLGVQATLPWGAPTQVVTPQTDQQITLAQGQTLEIALAYGRQLRLTPIRSSSLTLDQPAGYTDTASKSCVWHFTAKGAGSTALNFQSAALCEAHHPCSGAIAEMNVTVTVK